jgi:23S rRNA pseudouridine1911/1915/1917 synthase
VTDSDERDEAPPIVFEISREEEGSRLDKLVLEHVEWLGRRGAADLFARGNVLVGRRPAKKGERAVAGDRITVIAGEGTVRPEPNAPLQVVLETEAVVIVHKPAGQPTVPLDVEERGTLAAALVARFPEMQTVGYRAREPGVIHRLDTQTSGLVVAARSAPVFERLRAALSAGAIEKRYLAIVRAAGLPESRIVESALGPDPADPRRVVVLAPGAGRLRTTRVRTIRVAGDWALVEAEVAHAYRHQVRAHLASMGHPIAGDALYGGPRADALGGRHALHASYAAWAGDDVVRGFEATDPLPPDLAALMGD